MTPTLCLPSTGAAYGPSIHTSGVAMGNEHCRGRIAGPYTYKGNERGISGEFTQVIQTEHTRNKWFLIRTHKVQVICIRPWSGSISKPAKGQEALTTLF